MVVMLFLGTSLLYISIGTKIRTCGACIWNRGINFIRDTILLRFFSFLLVVMLLLGIHGAIEDMNFGVFRECI